MEDSEIVDLYWARSESAIHETEKQYGGLLRRIAGNILGSSEDAEEVVEDAYLQAWNVIPPQRPNVLKFFLTRITRNLALNRLAYDSAAKRKPGCMLWLEELEAILPAREGSAEDVVERKELTALLNRFLSELPPLECSVFLARYYYAEGLKEVARRYALSEGKVKYMLLKTRNKLKARLTEEGLIE